MNMQAFLQQAYATDKAAADAAYEALMELEESQHRLRMDAYANMRSEALSRLSEKYGAGFEQPTE